MHENIRLQSADRSVEEDPVARAISNLPWRLIASAVDIGTQFVVITVLAHFMPPQDFGVLSLALIVTGLAATFSEIGIVPALVQHPNLTRRHVRVAFTFSVIIGSLATAALWGIAPFVAIFFRQVEVVPVLRLVSLSLLFENVGAVSRSLLLRQIDFKKQAWAEGIANLVVYAPVSIGLGLLGYGVWALATGLVIKGATRSAAFLVMAPHSKIPLLSRRETSEVLRIGVGVSMTKLTNFAAMNGDYAVVGRWLGVEVLGLYQLAYKVAMLPLTFVTAEISNVLFPAIAAIKSDHRRLQSVHRGALVLVILIAFPSAIAIAMSASHFVPFLFGNLWVGSVVPLQILCIGVVFQAAYNLADALARATGAVYHQAFRHLIYAVALIAFSLMGMQWGLTGVAFGVVAAIVVIASLMSQLSVRLLGSRWHEELRMYIPGLLVGLGAGAGGALPLVVSRALQLPHVVSAVLILLGAAAGALVALTGICASWAGRDVREMVSEAVHLIPYATVRSWLLKRVQADIEFRESLFAAAKKWVKKSPALARTAHRVREEWTLLRYAVREGLWRVALGSRIRILENPSQTIITWDVNLPEVASPMDLERWFTQQGLTVMQGSHTLYLPPQKSLAAVLGDCIKLYPPDAGLKILKDLRPPEEAWYMSREWGGPIAASLVGSPTDQLVTANWLYANKFSPRVYDLCCLQSGATRLTAFVVQHIDGNPPSEAVCLQFLSRLKKCMEQSELRTILPAWRTETDFQPPTCHGNLLMPLDSNRPQYVDFQAFRLRDGTRWRYEVLEAASAVLHFGDEHARLGGRYLYQSIPGMSARAKRQTSKRWAAICEQLDRNRLTLGGRLILDVGCNGGMIMAATLQEGALWGIGWDLPPVIFYAESLLLSLGLTRFNLNPVELHRGYDLQKDIPTHLCGKLSESVVLYLAVRRHLGVLDCLQRLPWRILIYEGHEGERCEDLKNDIGPLLRRDVRIIPLGYMTDGFSGRRPSAILVRE